MNEGVWQYLWGFIHAQRLGITLCCFLLLIAVIVIAFSPDKKSLIATHNYDSLLLEKKHYKTQKNYSYHTRIASKKKADTLFNFDPNTVSYKDLQLLGFSRKQIAVINKYRAKVHFYTASDFAKIYVVNPQHFKHLEAFIIITDTTRSRPKTIKHKNFITIEINKADSAELQSLPLIGSKRSQTILKYRRKLGGFYETAQLHEVYGLNDSIIQIILPHLQVDTSLLVKINVNTANFKDLQQHPYVGYQLAKQILEYRRIKGQITKLSDFLNDRILSDEQYRKIKHYFIVN